MHGTRSPLVLVAVAAMTGSLLAKWFPQPFSILMLGGLVAGVFWTVLPRSPIWRFLSDHRREILKNTSVLLLVCLAFQSWAQLNFYSTRDDDFRKALSFSPQTISLKVIVQGEPRVSARGTSSRASVDVWVQESFSGGDWRNASGKLRAHLIGEEILLRELRFGQPLMIHGLVRKLRGPSYPGDFDSAAWLWTQGISHEVNVPHDGWALIDSHSNWNGESWLWRGAHSLRREMSQALRYGLEDAPATVALMEGMLFGYRQDIDDGLEEKFRRTGTLHLFAVSGQNVAVVMGALLVLFPWMGLVRWRLAWIVLPLVGVFCLATGMEASAARAFFMISVLAIGWSMNRTASPLNILSFAALVMWVWNPRVLFEVGFQLSYLVVLGLVTCVPPLHLRMMKLVDADKWIPKRLLTPWYWGMREGWKWTSGLFLSSLIAWLFSLPVILWNFSLFAPVTVFVNLLVVPFAAVVVLCCAWSVLFFRWLPLISLGTNTLSASCLSIVVLFVDLGASLPSSAVGPWNLSTALFEQHPRWTFLQNRGSTTLIFKSGEGKVMVVDPGTEEDVRLKLIPYLRSQGVSLIEAVILSRSSKSHMSGALLLERNFRVKTWFHSGWLSRSSEARRVWAGLLQKKVSLRSLNAGEQWKLSTKKSTRLEVLWPPRDEKFSRVNETGMVFLIHEGRGESAHRVLWASDIPHSVEEKLLSRMSGLMRNSQPLDALFQGVSGAMSGNLSDEWLRYWKPRYLIRPAKPYHADTGFSSELLELALQEEVQLIWMTHTGSISLIPKEDFTEGVKIDWKAGE